VSKHCLSDSHKNTSVDAESAEGESANDFVTLKARVILSRSLTCEQTLFI
jgi:hypothetical protein